MRITAYPKALPIPSKKDLQRPLPKANASNLPIIIQLVMIRPMNTDKVLLNSYAKALRTKSTIITRVAITVN